MHRLVLALAALAILAGCAIKKGSGKEGSLVWKVYQEEYPVPAPSDPIRSGDVELRITRVFLEENKTAVATSHWVARLYCTVVSPKELPLSSVSDAFTLIGKSGKVYTGHVSTVGPGRRTWQHQEHTGRPTHLAATVPGELMVFTQVGDDKTHDELAAFTFRSLRIPLGR